MMHRFQPLLMLLMLALSACNAPALLPVPTPARPATLRIELPGEPDINDLPRMVAADMLREMGYKVEALQVSDNTISTQALAQGEMDFANISTGVAWAAVQKGAEIASILDSNVEDRVLVAAPNLASCADLDGKRVGIQSPNSTQTLLFLRYLAKNCPDAKPETIVITGESNRLIALTAGQLDATTVNLLIFEEFQRKDKSDLRILANFTEAFPNLRTASQVVRRELLDKYPETVKDYVRAMVLARRKMQDPQFLREQIVKYLKATPEDAQETAALLLARPAWDLNGGWTPELVQSTLDFYVESGLLQPGLNPEEIADLQPLNAVLNEIGRK